jgi:hypothetical protein
LREVVLPALDVAGARHVVEVGGEVGGFTRYLADRARETDGHVHIVDPAPSPELEQLVDDTPHLTLVREPSPAALGSIDDVDAYLFDGDHNYATVLGELTAVWESAGGSFPLVVVHDVGWPCARRDQYYRPDALPAADVHPYSYEGGVRPGQRTVGIGGFSGAGEFAYAIEEGGKRNGVLTAVEDFLAGHASLEMVRVPCVFGLGIVFDRGAPYGDALREQLVAYDDNPLLARLEENRIALYIRVHDALADLDSAIAERDAARAALEELRAALRALAASRTVRTFDAVTLRPGGRLRRVLDGLAGDPQPGEDDAPG